MSTADLYFEKARASYGACDDCEECAHFESTLGFPMNSITCNAMTPKSVYAFERCPHPMLKIKKQVELKNCPFCGGKAEWCDGWFYVGHTKNCYSNPGGHDYEQHDACEADAWNQRVKDSA